VLEAGRGLLIGAPVRVALAFASLVAIAVLLSIFALRALRRAETSGYSPG
jgi:hypothetical protein